MRNIFLDVDGVLNYLLTKDRLKILDIRVDVESLLMERNFEVD